MRKILNYLFDPLCGWCYGVGAVLPEIIASTGLELKLIPTGLFSAHGARKMDAAFAQYAWTNDQRIAHLTGQVFSEQYRSQVLADHQALFDSGPATLALTAICMTQPAREYEAMAAIQHARYVDAHDITDWTFLARRLAEMDLVKASALLSERALPLLAANTARVTLGQELMKRFQARGVPTFILDDASGSRVLPAQAFFSSPQGLIRELTA